MEKKDTPHSTERHLAASFAGKRRARRRQRGIGTVEYVLITAAMLAALLTPFGEQDASVVTRLIDAIQSQHRAFLFAASLPVIVSPDGWSGGEPNGDPGPGGIFGNDADNGSVGGANGGGSTVGSGSGNGQSLGSYNEPGEGPVAASAPARVPAAAASAVPAIRPTALADRAAIPVPQGVVPITTITAPPVAAANGETVTISTGVCC